MFGLFLVNLYAREGFEVQRPCTFLPDPSVLHPVFYEAAVTQIVPTLTYFIKTQGELCVFVVLVERVLIGTMPCHV